MDLIAGFIHRALGLVGDDKALRAMQQEVAEFCLSFPLHQPVVNPEP